MALKGISFVAAFLLAAITTVADAQAAQEEYVKGQVIVAYHESSIFKSPPRMSVPKRLGLVVVIEIEIGGMPVQVVETPIGQEQQKVDELKNQAGVKYAELNYIYRASKTPNDYDSQLWGLRKIQSEQAWDTSTGGSGTIVGVVDTGIDYNHPDLAANLWKNPGEVAGNGRDDDSNGYVDDVYGWNCAANNGNPMDDNKHGSHVAGTIGAVGNNGAGVVGVNWSVKLMALKFLKSDGSGDTAAAITCINYGVTMGAKVLNNSWGGGGKSQALEDAITNANSKGVVFVAAAGNGGLDGVGDDIDGSPEYPASYRVDNVITVAATDSADKLGSFSNFGQKSVHLAAPGVSIYSTTPGNKYETLSGTSMATPHVSGVAALVLSAKPSLTVPKLVSAIVSQSDEISAVASKTVSGARLNSYKAVKVVATNGILVTPGYGRAVVNGQIQFSASGGSGSGYAWTVSNGAVASIDATGLLTAKAEGKTKVVAKDSAGATGSSSYVVVSTSNSEPNPFPLPGDGGGGCAMVFLESNAPSSSWIPVGLTALALLTLRRRKS